MSFKVSRWFPRHRKVLMLTLPAVIVALSVSVPLASSAASSKAGAGISPAVASRLTADLLGVAKASGDAHPGSIEAVATTRDKALRIATPGDTVPGSAGQSVYLAVIQGNFTLYDAPRPPKAHAPSGHYLAITLNPTTLKVLDLGLTNQAPPGSLGALGIVSNLIK